MPNLPTYEIVTGPAERSAANANPFVYPTKTITAETVRDLSADEIENAYFYARIGTTDDALVRVLRTDLVRRYIADGDESAIKKLIANLVFEAVGGVFENADLSSSGYVQAYDRDGYGIAIDVSKIDLDQIVDCD
jgi:hypothetical protein